MLIKVYHPQALSPSRLDKYLAGGWFRSGNILHRSQVSCIEGDVFSVVNIRVLLKDYVLKKRFRKLLNKNNKRFRISIQKAVIDKQKDALYQQHKHRFKGFIFDNLYQGLIGPFGDTIFDTYELTVYDGSKLVAASFFDIGKNSMASLLGLFDDDYRSYSLGVYTMLLEIQHALSLNKKYYYPGYILKEHKGFDYKLRLGNIQYYNWRGRWQPFEKIEQERWVATTLKQKMAKMQACLDLYGVSYHKLLYPLFSLGYLNALGHRFLQSALFLSCLHEEITDTYLVVEYSIEKNIYRLSWYEIFDYWPVFGGSFAHSTPPNSDTSYFFPLLRSEDILCETPYEHRIVAQLLKMLG